MRATRRRFGGGAWWSAGACGPPTISGNDRQRREGDEPRRSTAGPGDHAAATVVAEPKVEPGDTPLFNGKDLTGWNYKGDKTDLKGKAETPDRRFEVKDGALVANAKDAAGKGGIKDLYTNQQFEKDFNLKL